MAKYIPCYTCEMAREIARMVDIDGSGFISWGEWKARAKWVLSNYAEKNNDVGEVKSVDDVNRFIFTKLLLPMYARDKNERDAKEAEAAESATSTADVGE